MIQTEEQLKLIDLGAVRHIDDEDSAVYGTIGYQAPEIATTGPSIASDLYTIGRTLAVMTFPFDFQRTYLDRLPNPAEEPLLAEFDSYYRFLLRATASHPEARFASAEEMKDQLTGVLREVLAAEDGLPRQGPSDRVHPGAALVRHRIASSRRAGTAGARHDAAGAEGGRHRPGRRVPRDRHRDRARRRWSTS